MPELSTQAFDLLRLSMIPGIGPVLIARLVEAFGSPALVLTATARELKTVRGIGDDKAAAIIRNRDAASAAARAELDKAEVLGVRLIARGEPEYPPLLAQINDAPVILYVRGTIEPVGADRYPLALVGSRRCTQYGIEQAGRFAGAVAGAGLTIVSGGAAGIDTAAHRAALRAGGRTIAVLGCGLAHTYPPENTPLFDQIAAGQGAVISELPLETPPTSDNFPARNRLISGLSLGTLVIEAGRSSGALITARLAAEDHGREVFVVPGRVDSASSEGSNDLLKSGGAAMVTSPADIIEALQAPARHLFDGTHAARFGQAKQPAAAAPLGLTQRQSAILEALTNEMTLDELCTAAGVGPAELRADLTMLELQHRIIRRGTRIAKTTAVP